MSNSPDTFYGTSARERRAARFLDINDDEIREARLERCVNAMADFVSECSFSKRAQVLYLATDHLHAIETVRNRCASLFVPAVDIELDDMFADLHDRMSRYVDRLRAQILCAPNRSVRDDGEDSDEETAI